MEPGKYDELMKKTKRSPLFILDSWLDQFVELC